MEAQNSPPNPPSSAPTSPSPITPPLTEELPLLVCNTVPTLPSPTRCPSTYLLFRDCVCGQITHSHLSSASQTLADIEITWGQGELVKKSRFLGFLLRGSELVALGRAPKLPFDRFSDGGVPCLYLGSPWALQHEQGHSGKCVKQIWK